MPWIVVGSSESWSCIAWVSTHPIGSVHGIFTYMAWLVSMVNVGKYTIDGSYGHGSQVVTNPLGTLVLY